MSKIIERIARDLGVPDILSRLVDALPATDLQSLLLEVYRQRAARQQPAAVLADYEHNRFARPAPASPLRLLRWEQTAFAALPPDFQAIELSPVAPLGTCSAIAAVDQNRVLTTARGTEVVADSTNVLALEAALRRRQLLRINPKSKTPVHLAARHRLLRTQSYNDPHSIPHFSIFSLCSAGRDEGNLRFESAALVHHISIYLHALTAFLGADTPLQLELTDFHPTGRQAQIAEAVIAPLRQRFPQLVWSWDSTRESGRGYYVDLCFHINATNRAGEVLQLADGGIVDWTQRLLSNARERCCISGLGSERLCTAF